MKNLSMATNNKTMSSREIADLVESRHDHVKVSIERLAKSGAIQHPPMRDVKNDKGQTVAIYEINKRDSYVVVAQLSPQFTGRLVDRWQELESTQLDPMQALNDPAMMRSLLLTYSEKVLSQEKEIIELKPKATALDRLSSGEGSQCITDAAKVLKVQPKSLFQKLQSIQWIYKRAGGKNWLGYQDKIQQGLIEHKLTTVTRSDGSEKVTEQALLTPKGITKLSGILGMAQ